MPCCGLEPGAGRGPNELGSCGAELTTKPDWHRKVVPAQKNDRMIGTRDDPIDPDSVGTALARLCRNDGPVNVPRPSAAIGTVPRTRATPPEPEHAEQDRVGDPEAALDVGGEDFS